MKISSEMASMQGRGNQAQTFQPGKRLQKEDYNRGFISHRGSERNREWHGWDEEGAKSLAERKEKQWEMGSEQAKRKQLLIKCEIQLWNSLPWDGMSEKAYMGTRGGCQISGKEGY